MSPPPRGAALRDVAEPAPDDAEIVPQPEDLASGARRRPRLRPWQVIAVLLAIVSVPLVVAAVALRSPRWFPILDLSMTELRVRDVGGRHTPLIGLPGRIGNLTEQGSHPGPLSFWALAPFYRLFGSTAWALEAATVALHMIAMGVALWIAHRRGGVRLVLAVGLLLAVLTRGYGTGTLTEPWNPYLPLLFWIVVLLGVWSVACGDLVLLPVVAIAASFCAQTHVPYLPITVGMGALAVSAAVLGVRQARREPEGDRRALRWLVTTAGVLVAVWIPPVIDQLTGRQPNLSMLFNHFLSPPEEAVGFGKGARLLLLHLNVWRFLIDQQGASGSLVRAAQEPSGSIIPGLIVLGVWAGSVVTAWRLRHQTLLRLHLVVGVALVLGFVGMSRIFGQVWYYLMLWAWGITALLVLAVIWTAVVALGPRLRDPVRHRAAMIAAPVIIVLTLASTTLFAIDATDAEVPAAGLSTTLGQIVAQTAAALDAGEGEATGRDGRYLVSWVDAAYIGAQGFGLVNELERRGFDVGVAHPYRVGATHHRVLEQQDATAIVEFVTGVHVARWRQRPGTVEVAFVDPRTPAEQMEYARLRKRVIEDLRRAGADDRIVDVDENLFAAAIDPRVPRATKDRMQQMMDLGRPTAVFVAPWDTRI